MIKVKFDTGRLSQKMRKIADVEVDKALEAAAHMVRNTAIEKIQKSPASGVVYQKYNPRRQHQASAPGEPPATDLGTLVSSIIVRRGRKKDGKTETEVVAQASYAAILEEDMNRPFMKPSLEENIPAIKKLVGKDFKSDIQRRARK